jgi:hypothetical protein
LATNPLKIRLGAADTMIWYAGQANAVDLGASMGGIELTYNPTVFAIEIDQAPMPVQAYRTKEEVELAVVVMQYQMALLNATLGYGTPSSSGVTTTASGSLTTPTGGAASVIGTPASTTYTYTWVAFSSAGDGIPGTAITTATGPVSLSSANYVSITGPAAVTGAVGYKLIRTAGGAAQGLIGTYYGAPPASVSDTGLVATAYTPSASNPSYPNSDQIWFGGTVYVPRGTFDWSVPKNDGTTNHLRGRLNLVYSAKSIKIDHKREKATEINKLSLACLADTSQVAGRQAGWLVEEY